MLEVKKLNKQFASGETTVKAVNDVSFSVPEGKFIAIVGRSGSGKSTLLSLLGTLDRPTSGQIIVDGQDITSFGNHKLVKYRGKEIGFIFQHYNLIPNLSALENVMLPMELAGISKTERQERAAKLLNEVGLAGSQQQRQPGRLSGGEQQRVAIARAIANQPKLILADEPTGNLDSDTGKVIFDLLHKLSRTEKTTIIAVTHDLSIAGRTDEVIKIADGKLVK